MRFDRSQRSNNVNSMDGERDFVGGNNNNSYNNTQMTITKRCKVFYFSFVIVFLRFDFVIVKLINFMETGKRFSDLLSASDSDPLPTLYIVM